MKNTIPTTLKYQIALLLLLILSSQNFLHIVKDAMPMTLGNGFSMIPILRIMSMIITTLLFPIYYFLINRYSIADIFIAFFMLSIIMLLTLGFIIFPSQINNSMINISNSIEGVIYYWHISLFYIFCDIWTFLAYGLLFWNTLNTAFNNHQAKEHYNFFLSFGNTGLIIAGILSLVIFNKKIRLDSNLIQIQFLFIILSAIFLLCIAIVYYISNQYLSNMRKEHMKNKSKKLKLNIIESIKYIIGNKYIMLMFLLSISYSVVQQLAEPHYQEEKKKMFNTFNNFVQINSVISIIIGIISIILNHYGKKIYNRISWLGTSLIAPISITFFLSLFLISKIIARIFAVENIYLHYIIFSLSILQFIVIKSIRFSIWDFSFEMLYVPLNSEQQSKGKAAISLLSAKYGKALAQLYLMTTTDPFLILITVSILASIWIYSTINIAKKYNKYIQEENLQLNSNTVSNNKEK